MAPTRQSVAGVALLALLGLAPTAGYALGGRAVGHPSRQALRHALQRNLRNLPQPIKLPEASGPLQRSLFGRGTAQKSSAGTIDSRSGGGVSPLASTAVHTAALVAGACATYYLNNNMGLGPVAGCGATALFAGAVMPAAPAFAAFLGTCPGMAQTGVIANIYMCGIIAAFSGITMNFFNRKKMFMGVGGRVGLAAQLTCTLYFALSHNILPKLLDGTKLAATMVTDAGKNAVLTGGPGGLASMEITKATFAAWQTLLPQMMGAAVLGAFSMRAFRRLFRRFPNKLGSNIAVAGLTGLLAGLYLPAHAAGPALAGAFAAMSAPTVLPNRRWLLVAALATGLCQFAFTGVLVGGWSGKLGTNALIGILGCKLITSLYSGVKGVFSPSQSNAAKLN